MKKDTVVLGLGNRLMSDEGIGTLIVERFLTEAEKYPSVEFINLGTRGVSILHYIDSRRKVIMVDCAYMGTQPGTIKRFRPDEVKSVKKLAHQSLHEIDALKIIELARKLNLAPQQIVIYGIEPEHVKPGQQLSETLTKKMDDYITALSQELPHS